MPRYVLLEHTGGPDDPAGLHYDLLLEDGDACRTWRLAAIPTAGGGVVAATEIARHRLVWLDAIDEDVSGGRGHVRRVAAGSFSPVPGSANAFDLHDGPLAGLVELVGVNAGPGSA